LVVPVDKEVYLVPLSLNEFIDHAHKVKLLVVEVAESKEGDVLPLVLREVCQLWHGQGLVNCFVP